MRNTNKTIGGQAVIEGVMMKSSEGWAVAVRNAEGEIIIKRERLKDKNLFTKIPLLKGFFILLQTLWIGMKAIDFSSKVFFKDEKSNPWSLFFSLILAFIIGLTLFVLLPLYLTKLIGYLLSSVLTNTFIFNLVDGIMRVLIFILYVFSISLWPQMNRIFAYHGAEHKVINAFEKENSLEISTAQRYERFHVRCGTSFIFIVLVISILVFSTIPSSWNFMLKVLSRVVLLPLIAGISYEILKLSSRLENSLVGKIIIAPGISFQKITTKEPDLKQLEVAVEALKGVLNLEKSDDLNEGGQYAK